MSDDTRNSSNGHYPSLITVPGSAFVGVGKSKGSLEQKVVGVGLGKRVDGGGRVVEIGTSGIEAANREGGSLQKGVDFGGWVSLEDTKVVSSGIPELGDVGSSSSDEGESARLVMTGGNEGMTMVGESDDHEDGGGGSTDCEEGTGLTIGHGGRSSCLFARGPQDHSVSSPK